MAITVTIISSNSFSSLNFVLKINFFLLLSLDLPNNFYFFSLDVELVNRCLKIIDLGDTRGPFRNIMSRVKPNYLFVPFLADVTLGGVGPVISLLNVVMTQNSRINDIIHVTSHRILNKKVKSNLINTHEEKCHFSG